MKVKLQPHITTFTGKKMDPLWPEFDIKDIAHALSNTCRFTGHADFYSVAQHSVYVSYNTKSGLDGLLHDGAEAYLHDINRVLKHKWWMLPYRIAERVVERDMYDYFAIRHNEDDCKQADRRIYEVERYHLFPNDNYGYPCIGADIGGKAFVPMSPKVAEQLFLNRWKELRRNHGLE